MLKFNKKEMKITFFFELSASHLHKAAVSLVFLCLHIVSVRENSLMYTS